MSEFKTISEVADQLQLPQHVLRFWESQFSQIKPAKRRGGRRFYAPQDLETIQKIQNLLYVKGYTIKGAKKALNQNFMPTGIPDKPKIEIKQIDIFEVIDKSAEIDKSRLKNILTSLKAAEQLLHAQPIHHPEYETYASSDA